MCLCVLGEVGEEKKYVSWLPFGEELELKALCKSILLSLAYTWCSFLVFHAPSLMKTN